MNSSFISPDLILKEKRKNQVILFGSILLISFSVFNLSASIYGQLESPHVPPNSTSTDPPNSTSTDPFYELIISQIITIVVPYAGGLVGILATYLRSKGLQISKDAEQYLVGATQSVVENQSRLLFNKVYKNRDLLGAWATNTLDAEGKETLKKELNQYQTEAKANAVRLLEKEINSSQFKKTAKNMIGENLDALIESAYTKNQSNKAERAKNLLTDLSGLAVDSALLYFDNRSLSKEDKDKIIQQGIKIIAKNFDFEYLVLDVSIAKMYLESALSKRIA